MKHSDLVKHHHMTVDELEATLLQKEQELVDARVKASLNQEKNVHLSKSIRHDIARIKTIIHHKNIIGEESSLPPAKPKTTKPEKPKQPAKATKQKKVTSKKA